MTLSKFLQGCGCVALLATGALALQLTFVVPQFQAMANHLDAEVALQSHQMVLTQFEARKTLMHTRNEVTALRIIATFKLGEINETLDRRLYQANRILGLTGVELLNEFNRTNYAIARAVIAIESVTEHTANITSQVETALPMFLDCQYDLANTKYQGNPACLYSRWAAGSKATIDTLGTIDKTLPEIMAAYIVVADSLAKTADAYTVIAKDGHELKERWTKRSWLGKIWDLLTGLGVPAVRRVP